MNYGSLSSYELNSKPLSYYSRLINSGASCEAMFSKDWDFTKKLFIDPLKQNLHVTGDAVFLINNSEKPVSIKDFPFHQFSTLNNILYGNSKIHCLYNDTTYEAGSFAIYNKDKHVDIERNKNYLIVPIGYIKNNNIISDFMNTNTSVLDDNSSYTVLQDYSFEIEETNGIKKLHILQKNKGNDFVSGEQFIQIAKHVDYITIQKDYDIDLYEELVKTQKQVIII